MAGGNKVIGVMSRNLYLGAELTPVIQAQDLPQFLAATTAVWSMVQKNDFHARAQAVAAEIAANRPALVGLQEAYTWRTQVPADGMASPATDVAYDYVPELIAALAQRGLQYRAVATVDLFDFEAPTLLGNDARLTDHGVILARQDVHASNPRGKVFTTLLPVGVLGQTVLVKRGWVSVDVKYRGEQLRFVSTHLESFHPGVRQAQAAELAATLSAEGGQVILVGDLNSHPGTEGAAILVGAGFTDAWAALNPTNPGLTCCWPEDLTSTSPPFSERIDYVLTRGIVGPVAAGITGDDLASRVSGLWPSDHGGLFAELRIANEKH
jgi:endonuclease/exonuclease/phosphatase family metal-dependent hydrolase